MKGQLAAEARRARRHRGEGEGREKAWSLRALRAPAASWSFVLALLMCAPETIVQPATPESARVRMRRLLILPQEKAPLAAEVLQKSEDGEVAIEDIRFRAGRDVWVPGIVVKPRATSKPLPAIICLPGTGGTRQQLTDARLQLSERPRTGWARALAAQGFLTISLDYRGSEARGQNIYTDAVRAQLEGRCYIAKGRPAITRSTSIPQVFSNCSPAISLKCSPRSRHAPCWSSGAIRIRECRSKACECWSRRSNRSMRVAAL